MYSRKQIILLSFALFLSTVIIIILIGFLNKITAPDVSSVPTSFSSSIQQRVSEGERILVSQEEVSEANDAFRQAKQRGVDAFVNRDYARAANEFRSALDIYKNSPETLIYLNNAAIGMAQSYTIAVVGPFSTNPNALAILRGVALAQQQINQGDGINGVKLRIKLASDDNGSEIARELASFLAEDPSILGVIGHYSSNVTLAAKEIYDARHVPVISATSTSIDLSQTVPGETRYFFRTVPNDAFAATALARHLLNDWQLNKVAIFFDSQSSYSVSLKSEFAEEVAQGNGDVVAEFDFSQSSFDPIQAFRESVNAKAESLMLAAHSNVFEATFSIVRENAGDLKLLAGDELYDFRILKELGESAVSMVVPSSWDISIEPAAEFTQRSLELWDARVNWFSAMAYDATQAFIVAIAQNPTRDGIQKTLSSPNFNAPGVSYPVRFTPSGDRQGKVYLMEVKRSAPDNPFPSGADFDFVPVQTQ